MAPGCGNQQVSRAGKVLAGQEGGRPTAGQCEAGCGSDDTARPLGRIRRKRFAEQVGAAARKLSEPRQVGRRGRRPTTEYRVAGNGGFGESDRRIAVQHGLESLVANVRTGRRAEGLAIPPDCDVAQRTHPTFSTALASWSWNCSRSSHTIARVGQRNVASGDAGPPAE